MGSHCQLPEHFLNMTTLKYILTHTLHMIFRKSRMGSHCISCRDFFKFDHLVIGSYSYFVYDDLGVAGWAATATAAGTKEPSGTD